MSMVFDKVSKSYGGRVVLHPTYLRVETGETHALVGQSGSGKSTMLRLLLGLITPDAGIVQLSGQTVSHQNARSLRHTVGYVIQDGGLFPHLTGAENARLLARDLGWDATRCNRRLKELADLVQLPLEALDRYPVQVSGGQRQRVGLIRALMLDPPFLLLDEPLGALDPLIRAELQRELKSIFAQLKKTVLLVTHDLGEAAFFSERISVLHAGRMLQTGTMAELRETPADPYVAEFVRAEQQTRLAAA